MNSYSQPGTIEKKKAKEINLRELFLVIKKRLWIIIILTLIAGSVGFFQIMKPVIPLYQTSSRVIIGADDQTRATLQVIVKDSTVLDQVVEELDLKESSNALANQITVSSIDSTQVVSISVVDTDPFRAARIADTTAQVFKDTVPTIMGQNDIRLLSDSKVNRTPINPQSHKKILYYLIFGLVAGIGIVFLLDSLDDTVSSEYEIEYILEAPVLGLISKMNNKNMNKHKTKTRKLEQRGESIGFE